MPRKPALDELPPADSPLAPKVRRTRARKDAAEPTPDASPAPAADPSAASKGSRLKSEVAGIVLLLGSLFIAGALIFGRTPAYSESCSVAGGAFGPVGGCIRWSVLGLVGALAAVIVPLIPAVHGLRLLGRLEESEDQRFLFFTIGLAALIPVAAGLARLDAVPPGSADILTGLWGSFAAYYLTQIIGFAGAWIVVAIGFSALAAVTIGWNPVRALLNIGRAKNGVHHEGTKGSEVTAAEAMEPDASEMPTVDLSLMGLEPKSLLREPEPARVETPIDTLVEEKADDPQLALKGSKAKAAKRKAARSDDSETDAEDTAAPSSKGTANVPDPDELPSIELLTPPPPRNEAANKAALDAMGAKLIESLSTFKVSGTLTGRTSGPTVTQYEIEPAPGVKVRQFANLSNDLALAMRAPSIRIVAPIPGKGAVGVEVPNPTPEMVAFREMLESKDYQSKPMALPIGLGRDLEGRPVIADLAKMPHLLIAGATGSGKSVCVNTIITSLIYRHTPKTLRFLMVDPKMVELSVYNVLPHLRHKVVTDNRDAASVLKWAVLEMQERYALLAENGARNIQDFNQKVRDGLELKKPKDPNVGFEDRTYTGGILPYIVVVIDELADLMMTVAAEVETPLAMLAQKARAIGIHLILATQRPSVNVITGLIKANFPSRIAFRVASQIDSRTILDGMGAESLLGNGDMLFIPPGKSEPSRLQGAFLSNDDTERLVSWYRERKEARKAALEAQGLMVSDTTPEDDILAKVKAMEALEAGGGEERHPGARPVGDQGQLPHDAVGPVLRACDGVTDAATGQQLVEGEAGQERTGPGLGRPGGCRREVERGRAVLTVHPQPGRARVERVPVQHAAQLEHRAVDEGLGHLRGPGHHLHGEVADVAGRHDAGAVDGPPWRPLRGPRLGAGQPLAPRDPVRADLQPQSPVPVAEAAAVRERGDRHGGLEAAPVVVGEPVGSGLGHVGAVHRAYVQRDDSLRVAALLQREPDARGTPRGEVHERDVGPAGQHQVVAAPADVLDAAAQRQLVTVEPVDRVGDAQRRVTAERVVRPEAPALADDRRRLDLTGLLEPQDLEQLRHQAAPDEVPLQPVDRGQAVEHLGVGAVEVVVDEVEEERAEVVVGLVERDEEVAQVLLGDRPVVGPFEVLLAVLGEEAAHPVDGAGPVADGAGLGAPLRDGRAVPDPGAPQVDRLA